MGLTRVATGVRQSTGLRLAGRDVSHRVSPPLRVVAPDVTAAVATVIVHTGVLARCSEKAALVETPRANILSQSEAGAYRWADAPSIGGGRKPKHRAP